MRRALASLAVLLAACADEPQPAGEDLDAGPDPDPLPPVVIVIKADGGPPIPPPVGQACRYDDECYPNGECWRGVCTGPCGENADCGTEVVSHCLTVPELGGKRCVEDARRCYAVPEGRDLLGEALATAGLDRCAVGYPANTLAQFGSLVANDEFRMPYFNAVFFSGLRLPDFEDRLANELDQAQAGPSPVAAVLARAARELGSTVSEEPYPDPPSSATPLAAAVGALISARGGSPDNAALQSDATDVPMALQLALARVVNGIREAAAARDRMLGSNSAATAYSYAGGWILRRKDQLALDPSNTTVRRMLSTGYKYAEVFQAAARLAATVQAENWSAHTGAAGFSFSAATPVGRILVRDAAVHLHAATDPVYAGDLALLVDTGGDDVYTVSAGGNSSAKNPVSVLLDLAGNDTYAYQVVPDPRDGDTPQRLPSDAGGRDSSTEYATQGGPISYSDSARQGAGRAGIGLLFDLGGNDHYRSLRMSQGFGGTGAGALYDAAGDDLYEGEVGVQGAGVFGIGALLDRSGNDRYKTWSASQGFASIRAVGLLLDGAGADVYHADVGDPALGGDPLYFSVHQPGKGNRSFVQGAGFGLRESQFGAHMSGGIGFLLDRGGSDDRYLSSVYGQATGYWFGSGFLDDDGGNDRYQGIVWAQGTTAHFAMSLFRDRSGNDLYNTDFPAIEDVIGLAHDFSVSWLIEEGGDDVYRGGSWRNMIGVGLTNGLGFLTDLGGADEYRSYTDRGLGFADVQSAEAARLDRLTLGLLVDAGGVDSYFKLDAAIAADGRTLLTRPRGLATEDGVQIDGNGVAVPLAW